jgi:hypothetical protein
MELTGRGLVGSRHWVIWGLKSKRNSFRYIWEGFYETLVNLGEAVSWVDDKEKNSGIVTSKSIVLSVGISNRYLPINNHAKYILHNVEDQRFYQSSNHLSLQVWHSEAKGEPVDDSIALFSPKDNVLYQPWGIAEEQKLWKIPASSRKKLEYWVGSVWNNSLNQGNLQAIEAYKSILKSRGVSFRRVGGTRSWSRHGVRPKRALDLINQSAYGAAIVGNWQMNHGYVPCRLFKNVASGNIPLSNANYNHVFPGLGIFDSNLEELLEEVDQLARVEYLKRVAEAQVILAKYTYVRNLQRLIRFL